MLAYCVPSLSLLHVSVFVFQVFRFGIGITSRFLFNLTATRTSDLMIQRNVFQHTLMSLRCDGTRHNTAPKEQTGPFTEVLRYINQGFRAFVVAFIIIGLIFLRFFNYSMYIYHFWVLLGVIVYGDRVEGYFWPCNYGKEQRFKNSPTSLPGNGLLPRPIIPHYHWFKTPPLGPLFTWEKNRHRHSTNSQSLPCKWCKCPVSDVSKPCTFSRSIESCSLQAHGLQHAGLPCPSHTYTPPTLTPERSFLHAVSISVSGSHPSLAVFFPLCLMSKAIHSRAHPNPSISDVSGERQRGASLSVYSCSETGSCL